MKIINCHLDVKNGFSAGASTVGELVEASGKRRLWGKREGGSIDTVVIHYISAVNNARFKPYKLDKILRIFCDYGVSSHYLITRAGRVLRLVPERAKAWHCGGSVMPHPDNRTGVNDFSIGIELAGTETSAFSRRQYEALRALCLDIEKRHGRRMAYVGHEHIAGERAVAMGLRKDRKADPGPLFDWDAFMNGLRSA